MQLEVSDYDPTVCLRLECGVARDREPGRQRSFRMLASPPAMKVEFCHQLTVQTDLTVLVLDPDLVLIPLAERPDRQCIGAVGATKDVDRSRLVDRRSVRHGP